MRKLEYSIFIIFVKANYYFIFIILSWLSSKLASVKMGKRVKDLTKILYYVYRVFK